MWGEVGKETYIMEGKWGRVGNWLYIMVRCGEIINLDSI